MKKTKRYSACVEYITNSGKVGYLHFRGIRFEDVVAKLIGLKEGDEIIIGEYEDQEEAKVNSISWHCWVNDKMLTA